MRRARLIALLCLVAAACGGESRTGAANSGGGSIGADGTSVDGAIHSAFEGEGDGAGADSVIRGSGDVVANQDIPRGQDAVASDVPSVDQVSDASQDEGPGCEPACDGKLCGDDGCGGSCGLCPEDFPFCLSGFCSNCAPDCEGVVCGGDGCGGSCGSCPVSEVCLDGACVCEPACPPEACGSSDGCGGVCPPCVEPDAGDVGGDSDVVADVSIEDSVGPDSSDISSDSDSDAEPEDVEPVEDAVSDSSSDPDVVEDGGSAADAPEEDLAADGGETADVGPDGGEADSEGPEEDAEGPEEDAEPPIPAPVTGEFVITEIMRAPLDGAGVGRQWFEIVSVVDGARDLSGCTFTDALGSSFAVSAGQSILASQRLVFAQVGDDEDGLLGAGVLYPAVEDGGPDLSEVGTVTFECSTGVIDSIDLTLVAGATAFPDEPGRSMQLDVGATSATANDSPGVWCSSFKLYGAAGYGSPGVGNHPCDSEVDWCRIWSPGFKLAKVDELWEVTTHLHEEGLTDVTPNAPDSSPTLKAQVGYGLDGSLPAEIPDQWTWFTGVAVDDPPAAVPTADDRYVAVVTMTATGIYDVAGRFSLDDGFTWTYCDLDGSANGYSVSATGHATIIP